MQEVPSGLDHVPVWLFNSPLEEGWEDPLSHALRALGSGPTVHTCPMQYISHTTN